jgi:predicted NAD/FAD-binding protein
MTKASIALALPLAALTTALAGGSAVPLAAILVFNFLLGGTTAYLIHNALWRTVFDGSLP